MITRIIARRATGTRMYLIVFGACLRGDAATRRTTIRGARPLRVSHRNGGLAVGIGEVDRRGFRCRASALADTYHRAGG